MDPELSHTLTTPETGLTEDRGNFLHLFHAVAYFTLTP